MSKKALFIFLALVILLVPDLLLQDFKSNFCQSFFWIISKILLLFGILLLVNVFIKPIAKTYLLVGIFYLISSFSEIINIKLFQSLITLDVLKGLLFTLDNEISEFVEGFWNYFILPLILLILFLVVLYYLKKNPYIFSLKQKLIFGLISILISISINFTSRSFSALQFSGKNILKYTLRQDNLKQHPFNLYYRLYELAYSRYQFKKYNELKKHFSFGVMEISKDSLPDVVVLVIGERSRYKNWSINNYTKETNPLLNKTENLVVYSKNHANANSTANSIPMIITRATPQNFELAFSEKTIVSLYKEAGYETFWIASQGHCFDFIENKNEIDNVKEIYNLPEHTDLDVLPVFSSLIDLKSNKKKLIVINLIGGHGNVPKQFQKFSPNSFHKKTSISFENAPILINDYDNMILLQDYVLGNIIKKLQEKNQSSIFAYTSDHGCNLFDNGDVLFGYGTPNPTLNETHVPLLYWMSDKYVNANTELAKTLYNNRNCATTSNSIFYTLANLSKIKYKDFPLIKSTASTQYIVPKKRYVFVNNTALEYNP